MNHFFLPLLCLSLYYVNTLPFTWYCGTETRKNIIHLVKRLSMEKFTVQYENLPNFQILSLCLKWSLKRRHIVIWLLRQEQLPAYPLCLEICQSLHVQHIPQICLSPTVPFLSSSCHSPVHIRKLRVVYDSSLFSSQLPSPVNYTSQMCLMFTYATSFPLSPS